MLASLLQHGKVLTTERDDSMNVETDVAAGIQAVVAEFVRRVYSGFDERKVQTYCERHNLGALGLKRELCVDISLLLVDAPRARAQPAEGDNEEMEVEVDPAALYEVVKTRMLLDQLQMSEKVS